MRQPHGEMSIQRHGDCVLAKLAFVFVRGWAQIARIEDATLYATNTRIATAQIACRPGELDLNLETIAHVVDQAHREEVDVLVFPELSLSGYSVEDSLAESALRLDSHPIDILRQLSRDVAIAVGIVEETPDFRFYNSALFFAGGELLHVHRKIYPPNYGIFAERKLFAVGDSLSAFDTVYGRIAMLVCGDAWHPSLPYLAAHDGADLLIVMAASPQSGLGEGISSPDAWRRINSTYALTMSFFVCFSNRVGCEGPLQFTGHSHLVGPDGRILAECTDAEAGYAIAELRSGDLRKQRLNLPFRRDDRLDFVLDCGHRIRHSASLRDRQPLARLKASGDDVQSPPEKVAGKIVPRSPLGGFDERDEEEGARWAI